MPRHFRFALAIAALAAPAAAEPPRADLRLSGAIGSLEELTWTGPGVELCGRLELGRALVGLRLGYAPIDNHTYLSDARVISATASVGLERDGLRAAAIAGLEHVAFHADPDILAELPDTDLILRRSELVPTAGIEGAVDLAAYAAVGLFARGSPGRLELLRDADGRQRRGRLLLIGAFVEIRIR